ncbi:MAG TPA: cupredoxin domain-containing protein [Anaerolineales bacterium]
MLRKMFFILVLSLLLVGCGAKATQAAATEITVETTDFAYSPASITVPVGQPVTLTLKIWAQPSMILWLKK